MNRNDKSEERIKEMHTFFKWQVRIGAIVVVGYVLVCVYTICF